LDDDGINIKRNIYDYDDKDLNVDKPNSSDDTFIVEARRFIFVGLNLLLIIIVIM
jgi:hypothetical protein